MDDLPYIWQVRRGTLLPSKQYDFDERIGIICGDKPATDEAIKTAWVQVNGL